MPKKTIKNGVLGCFEVESHRSQTTDAQMGQRAAGPLVVLPPLRPPERLPQQGVPVPQPRPALHRELHLCLHGGGHQHEGQHLLWGQGTPPATPARLPAVSHLPPPQPGLALRRQKTNLTRNLACRHAQLRKATVFKQSVCAKGPP